MPVVRLDAKVSIVMDGVASEPLSDFSVAAGSGDGVAGMEEVSSSVSVAEAIKDWGSVLWATTAVSSA